MARFRQSLEITDLYRARLTGLADRAEALTRRAWAGVREDQIDQTANVWAENTATILEAFQRAGVRLTAAYLIAYLSAERGRPADPPVIDEDTIVGTVDGSPLPHALDGVKIAALTLIRDGAAPHDALHQAGSKAARLAATATLAAPRMALADQIRMHPEIIGWRRVTKGGCGACLAAADGITQPEHRPMLVHDHCHCTAEPVIRDVPDIHRRPTGRELFDGMTPEQQDESLGPTAATLVRSGQVPFDRLIDTSPMKRTADQLTQALVSALEQ